MKNFFIKIKDVIFRLKLDDEVASQMLKRIPSLSNNNEAGYNIDIICTLVKNINFTNDKFLDQQEPDINDDCYYREIFDLGLFRYDRKEKTLCINYSNTDRYPFNSFEIVVDTILQFIYLIMLEFESVPLHTAVLAYKEKAILLFGHSGSGKTTLELSLLNSGFLFFSDDIAFIDDDNYIYNSGEHIVACSKKTKKIISKCFDISFFDTVDINSTNKQVINIDSTMISEYENLIPHIIVFPALSNTIKGSLERISSKSAFIKLIELTISAQFTSSQKHIYMKRLKNLSTITQAFQYFWTEKDNNLQEICYKIRELCEQKEIIF